MMFWQLSAMGKVSVRPGLIRVARDQASRLQNHGTDRKVGQASSLSAANIGTRNRRRSPSTALRPPSPPVGEKDRMRGYGSWAISFSDCLATAKRFLLTALLALLLPVTTARLWAVVEYPSIVAQPQSQTVTNGGDAAFSVTA